MTASSENTCFVEVEGRKLFYRLSGKRDGGVVILEKGASGGGVWGSVVDRLGDRFTVVTYDRAGVGRSDPPARQPRVDAIADDLHRLIALVPFKRPVILVVWSLTGLSALLHAKRHGSDLKGIVFIDPTPFDYFDGPKVSGPLRYPKFTVSLQKLLGKLGYGSRWGRKSMEDMIRRGCGPNVDERYFGAYIDSLFDLLHGNALGELYHMRESCELVRDEMRGASLPAIPAVVLSAAVDTVIDDATAARKHANHRQYAALFPRGRYVRVEGGSHMMTLDRPDMIADAVMKLADGDLDAISGASAAR